MGADRVGLANISGVGIGYQVRDGNYTGKLALKVYVHRKVGDKGRIDKAALIPPSVRVGDYEFPTDVEKALPLAAQSVFTEPEGSSDKPIRPGTCIGVKGSQMSGTLGCLVTVREGGDRPVVCILSNAHVLAMDGNGKFVDGTKGLPDDSDSLHILQPGAFEHPATTTDIATLYQADPLTLSSTTPSLSDCAVAMTNAPDRGNFPFSPKHHTYELDPEPIKVFGDDQNELKGKRVMKEGFRTGLTFGTIMDVHQDRIVGYGEGGGAPHAHFTDAVVITGENGPFSQAGDSGSLIVDASTHQPVALLLGGDGHLMTIANAIADVMDALHIDLFLNSENIKRLSHRPA
jgi:hypothetical protein